MWDWAGSPCSGQSSTVHRLGMSRPPGSLPAPVWCLRPTWKLRSGGGAGGALLPGAGPRTSSAQPLLGLLSRQHLRPQPSIPRPQHICQTLLVTWPSLGSRGVGFWVLSRRPRGRGEPAHLGLSRCLPGITIGSETEFCSLRTPQPVGADRAASAPQPVTSSAQPVHTPLAFEACCCICRELGEPVWDSGLGLEPPFLPQ